jgi:hypothetical protein
MFAASRPSPCRTFFRKFYQMLDDSVTGRAEVGPTSKVSCGSYRMSMLFFREEVPWI